MVSNHSLNVMKYPFLSAINSIPYSRGGIIFLRLYLHGASVDGKELA
jgi:hypothetical protein